MRVIMGNRHREKIRSLMRPGSRVLEWGAGGSTVWLVANLPDGAMLTSVEHDPKWFHTVREYIGAVPQVRLLLREANGPLGGNATIEEEDPGPLHSFVHAVDGEQFDVILVDGYARSACLGQARQLLAPGGVVLLHDAQRAWYVEAKNIFTAYGHLGSCSDYPSPHLWWGGNGECGSSPAASGAFPLIISFYTKDTKYELEAKKLIESCQRHQLEHHVVGLDSRGSWEANCSLKSEFVFQTWQTCGRPVLWVDADAVLHGPPHLLCGCTADFAIHRCRGWQFASGTVYFNQTPGAARLIQRWIARCRQFPKVWDQENLDLAWEDTVAVYPLETMWLPETYCRIFDLHEGRSASPGVIEHFQASRRLKAEVSSAPSVPAAKVTPALLKARHACRPRSWLLSPADGVAWEDWLGGAARSQQSLLERVVDQFGQPGGPRSQVLLLHSGVGVLWRLLVERGYEVHALAPTDEYFNEAREFCGDRVHRGQATALPFSDGEMERALVLGVLEFLPEPDLQMALTELRRVVRDQVFLVIQTDPDPEDRWPPAPRARDWWLSRLRSSGFIEAQSKPQVDLPERGLPASVLAGAFQTTKRRIDGRGHNLSPVLQAVYRTVRQLVGKSAPTANR